MRIALKTSDELPNMTGIGSPYEAPTHPTTQINGAQPVQDAVAIINLHSANRITRKVSQSTSP